ncbi:MAG: purine-binding chemotaxis protein [Methanomethylovorans sp. PtaU1.Bin073]|jgi:purine-binding chemotaxis protein CheW|nr:MAG: purine-binding chemotaxis protein [Methanomethylovorans sp. PtaU1.Bin073]
MNTLMQKTQTVKKADSDLLQLVIFQLGGEEFGVDIMAVQEIIKMPEITAIPQAPEYVAGVINLRGKIIVVVSLGKKFDIQSCDKNEEYKVIVVELENQVIGMMVDSVSEVLRIPSSSVDPAPDIIKSGVSSNYIQGVGKLDDRLLILLDLRNVLSDYETEELTQFV